ncbi:3-oxoacyl-ACP reductase FabG [Shewanella sp. OPT22]|nr:3-oxoacyl-ACP reductase FabG [Shewanella sp. OPT22]
MFTLINGYTIIVTGGSKGIGRGIATAFAKQGANVMIAARDIQTATHTINELQQYSGQVEFYQCDVSDWQSVSNLINHTVKTFGQLDVMCANAGSYPMQSIEQMSPDDWDSILENNLKSSFMCVKAAMPHLAQSGHGRVILTSSITGAMTGVPGFSHYGASKAGQLGFMRTAAMELARHKITVNAILPGNIYTEGLKDLGQDYLDAMAAAIPLKRIGDVEDIGNTALFLASKEAAYITGQSIVVDGGQTLPESLGALEDC